MHKHKRKERKLKNSDKLSAYILVTHALPFSAMLESSLAPKGSPAARLRQISQSVLLRLRMSAYAYAYRTCKHPCAYAWAYACVVRVNQALSSLLSESAIARLICDIHVLHTNCHIRRRQTAASMVIRFSCFMLLLEYGEISF